MTTRTDASLPTSRRRVRVWFGNHTIADYIAEAALAARYEAAMRKRFAGLRVTSDVLDGDSGVRPRRLPSERLWELTP